MKMSLYDSMESKIQVAVLHERQKHFEDKVHSLEQELVRAHTDLGGKEKSLELLREERDELNVKLEVLRQIREIAPPKGRIKYVQIFSISLLFLLSSIFVNVGTNMSPANFLKTGLVAAVLVVAALLHLTATFLKARSTLEGGMNETK